MEPKIIKEHPPIYDKIIEAGMSPSSTAIYAYDGSIYNPSGKEIPDDIIAHEKVHLKQQDSGSDYWWSRYLDDQYFRIDQEAKAYAVQYDFLCIKYHDRNHRNKMLLFLADILSSATYGNVIGKMAAYKMIKNNAKTK